MDLTTWYTNMITKKTCRWWPRWRVSEGLRRRWRWGRYRCLSRQRGDLRNRLQSVSDRRTRSRRWFADWPQLDRPEPGQQSWRTEHRKTLPSSGLFIYGKMLLSSHFELCIVFIFDSSSFVLTRKKYDIWPTCSLRKVPSHLWEFSSVLSIFVTFILSASLFSQTVLIWS